VIWDDDDAAGLALATGARPTWQRGRCASRARGS